ncbi:hypothetical protein [Congregibacter litoralis]|uniref:RiboL-PSP-HEPN domain-containing protein n=1 Tax=Congregibacter litoralis KT71 TaxID=314285 RepID=A4AD29_9GAMM|nr:hypothetical protein [Congregibacter litoralis]EAQ96082.1 hypothetical protein KT71_08500 [Congregibacter litoralis KT71]
MQINSIDEFRRYLAREIEPAILDLANLDERNRIHIQKLIYTNMVDRFDTMVDSLILDNCREKGFFESSLSDMSGVVTESDLVKILIQGDNLQEALDEKLKSGLRNTLLRNRHSRKLTALFLVFQPEVNCVGVQRVNPPDGKIKAKVTPQNAVKIPYSISGYADWLYSRRNSIVHGGGTNRFLENDRAQLKKLYKREPAQTFSIKLGSLTVAAAFYKDVVDLLEA